VPEVVEMDETGIAMESIEGTWEELDLDVWKMCRITWENRKWQAGDREYDGEDWECSIKEAKVLKLLQSQGVT
jgi:hypothetical protein